MALQAAALEDAGVGVKHFLVVRRRSLVGGVEGVGVLHDEFAGAHEAEAGADFIAELCLDLIEVLGQLAVGTQFAGHQGGDGFLVGRAQHPFLFGAVAGL